MKRYLRILPFLLIPLAGCRGSEPGPTPGPGTLTARLTGPEAAEGAAHIRLVGSGIDDVIANGGRLFSEQSGDTVDVILALQTPGTLDFRVELTDTTRLPTATVIDVAGPDNALRTALSAYRVEWVR